MATWTTNLKCHHGTARCDAHLKRGPRCPRPAVSFVTIADEPAINRECSGENHYHVCGIHRRPGTLVGVSHWSDTMTADVEFFASALPGWRLRPVVAFRNPHRDAADHPSRATRTSGKRVCAAG